MTPTLTCTCSICGERSVSICVYCTKDACPNHLCDRCQRCSDCCECDIRLEEHPEHELTPELAPEPAPETTAAVLATLETAAPVVEPASPETPVDSPAAEEPGETPEHS